MNRSPLSTSRWYSTYTPRPGSQREPIRNESPDPLHTHLKRLPTEIVNVILGYVAESWVSLEDYDDFSAMATEKSAKMFLTMPLEIRQTIYSYFLPDKRSWIKIHEAKKTQDTGGSDDGAADLDSAIELTGAEEELRKITIARKSPGCQVKTDNAVTLMLVNAQVCAEVATMLYEHYTFELDLTEDGVRFLDLPVIQHLEQYGFKLTHGESKFGEGTLNSQVGNNESNWIFSFSRLKKLRLNIWGGFLRAQITKGLEWKPKQKCLYMRQNMQQLVRLLIGNGSLPHLDYLEVAMLDGKRNHSYEWDSSDDFLSSFWYHDTTHAPRRSLVSIDEQVREDEMFTNENFILQPLEALRGLSQISFKRYTLNDHKTPLESFQKPILQKKMESEEDYVPDLEFYRHVAQMEDALDKLKEIMRLRRQQHDRELAFVEDAWMDKEVERWDAEEAALSDIESNRVPV